MASPYEVKIIEQTHVSPAPGSDHRPSLPLTFFDIFWFHIHPVERLFLFDFPHPTSHFIRSQLPTLKSSLSLALARFYPLAGKVRRRPDSSKHFELHYVDGVDSVRFTSAETEADFSDLAGSHPRDYAKLRPLIPQLPNSDTEEPLLAIQVTVFPNRGICIAVAIHHVACDGVTSMHFIKSWAAACRSGGGSIPVDPPVYDRSLIADPWGLYETLHKDMIADHENKEQKPTPKPDLDSYADVVAATFTLGADQIERLKKLVQAKAEVAKVTFHCSAFVVTCAHVWVCLSKVRGFPIDQPVCCVFPADWRGRLSVPTAYFGNCMGPCYTMVKVGDLVGEDGIFMAAKGIGTTIATLKDDLFKSFDGFVQKMLAVPYAPLGVAGSPKFGVYETDFGWGRPRKVELPSIQKTGAMSLSESRAGGGGVEIGLILRRHEMEGFTAHFNNGLGF